MAEEDIMVLKDDFYRDRFGAVILIILSVFTAIGLLVALSVYLHLQKPVPITFSVDNDWRIQGDVPLDQPYLSEPAMLQWVSDALQNAFVVDFYHYDAQLKQSEQYFTPNGWKIFLSQLNNYASATTIQANKLFVSAAPAGAPYVVQQGLISGRYGWWVQIPIDVKSAGAVRVSTKNLVLQILVVRVSTLNNLSGVAIENVIVVNAPESASNLSGQTT